MRGLPRGLPGLHEPNPVFLVLVRVLRGGQLLRGHLPQQQDPQWHQMRRLPVELLHLRPADLAMRHLPGRHVYVLGLLPEHLPPELRRQPQLHPMCDALAVLPLVLQGLPPGLLPLLHRSSGSHRHRHSAEVLLPWYAPGYLPGFGHRLGGAGLLDRLRCDLVLVLCQLPGECDPWSGAQFGGSELASGGQPGVPEVLLQVLCGGYRLHQVAEKAHLHQHRLPGPGGGSQLQNSPHHLLEGHVEGVVISPAVLL